MTAAVRYMVTVFALLCSNAIAQPPRIAVIGRDGFVEPWCDLVVANGYECDTLSDTSPIGSIADYVLVIDISTQWTDPDGMLEDLIRSGRAAMTWGSIPSTLGINTDPIVQAWIGANRMETGTGQLFTVATDPMLGDLPVGTSLLGPNLGFWSAVDDTTGHPGAKVLAQFDSGTGAIGIMRNEWEGGHSVYLGQPIWPNNDLDNQIILNAVRELAQASIPTVSYWGLTVSTLLLLTAGSILVNRGPRHTTS